MLSVRVVLVVSVAAGCTERVPSVDDGRLDVGIRNDIGANLDAPPSDAAAEVDVSADVGSRIDTADDPRCDLRRSEPLRVTTAGTVIDGLHIVSDGAPAILIDGANDVVLRHLLIEHRGGFGIQIRNASRVRIEDVEVIHTGAPTSGPHASADENNIDVYASPELRALRVRTVRGSTGLYLHRSPNAVVAQLEGHDFRGPFPRGQLIQWNDSDDGVLEDFSVESPATAWPEDNVNAYASERIVIRRGLIDGNNAPSGVGVIFDGGSTGRVEDVDAVRMGNGCFSAYTGAGGSPFIRTRCADNICTDQGRGAPRSDGLMWAGNPAVRGLEIIDGVFSRACNPTNLVWPREAFSRIEIREEDFTPRAPLRLRFCWE